MWVSCKGDIHLHPSSTQTLTVTEGSFHLALANGSGRFLVDWFPSVRTAPWIYHLNDHFYAILKSCSPIRASEPRDVCVSSHLRNLDLRVHTDDENLDFVLSGSRSTTEGPIIPPERL